MPNKHKVVHGVADFIRAVAGKDKYRPTSAIIVAAGDSSRMGVNKQLLTLGGKPVLVRTVQAFEGADCIKEIIIVTRKEDVADVTDLCEKYKFHKIVAVVPGGATRQESVKRGFDEVSDKSDFVAIHDGARCLITPEMIENVCREAYIHGAAIAATRVTDTVKRTEKSAFSEETLDRNRIWLAQTPQVFGCNLYRTALYISQRDNITGTDDASLVEQIGYKAVRLVECGKDNIKLTTPDDIPFAEALLAARKYREVKRK